MYVIKKQFTFSAAHQLYDLPETHPCGRLHGHNYTVEVCLCSKKLGYKTEWIRDFRELDEFKHYLDHDVDHRNLNEVYAGMQTTAEALAWIFFQWCKTKWPETYLVRVSETPKTWAEYYEEQPNALDPETKTVFAVEGLSP